MGPGFLLHARVLWLALRRGGTRTLLALAAVGLGSGAAMISSSLGVGADGELSRVAKAAGRDLLTVRAGQVLAPPNRGTGWYVSRKLNRDDLAALRNGIARASAITPVLEGSFQVRHRRESLATSVRGVERDYTRLRGLRLATGRDLEDADDRERSRVAVVGALVARRLGRGASLVGETLWVGAVPFEVVGELAPRGATPDGQNEDDQILVPLETARRRLFNVEYLSRLLAQVPNAEAFPEVEARAREILRTRHALAEGTKDDFDILRPDRMNEIARRGRAFLLGLSGLFTIVTVAIGGAGVLAVSLLGVRERAWEIGLRRAVGARRRDITGQFLAEACLLSMLGGLIGIPVGALAIAILGSSTGWPMEIDLATLITPLAVSLLLGVIFGVGPAWMAARLDPVVALRDR